jgi:chromosome segregation protein
MSTVPTQKVGGIIGNRVLHAFQLIDIGRQQSHLTVMRPGTFVAVYGIGPTDSNETNKTTMAAAIDLLQGGRAWGTHLGQAGSYATDLLFRGSKRGGTSRAEHGYIVGVYGPEHAGLDLAGRPIDHVTVWMRINRTTPFLQVRITEGVLLAVGEHHAATIANADRVWADRLPSRPTYGEKQYIRDVLGDLPRSIGFVARRGGKPVKHLSLLTTDLERLEPEEIGDELIDLAGLRARVNEERTQRADLAPLQRQLSEATQQLAKAQQAADTELARMDARRDALHGMAEAVELRRVYELAKVTEAARRMGELRETKERIETSAAKAGLERDLATARLRVAELEDADALERALSAANERVTRTRPAAVAADQQLLDLRVDVQRLRKDSTNPDLLASAARHKGRDQGDIAAELSTAKDQQRSIEVDLRIAHKDHQAATDHVRAVTEGRGNPTAETLAAAGIDAVIVSDAIEPADPQLQAYLSVVLAPLGDIVAIADANLPTALAALSGMPGALLATGDPHDSTAVDGIHAPPVTRRLLRWLLDDQPKPHSGVALGPVVTIVGGFTEPQVGRQARIAAADAAVSATSGRVDKLERQLELRSAVTRDLEAELAAAEAAARLSRLRSDFNSALISLDAAATRLQPDLDAFAEAEQQRRAAQAELDGREQLLIDARHRVDTLERDYAYKITGPLADVAVEAQRVDLAGWAARAGVSWPDLRVGSGRSIAGLGADIPARDRALHVDADMLADLLEVTVDGLTAAIAGRDVGRGEPENLRRAYNRRTGEALTNINVRIDTRLEGDREVTVVAADPGTPTPIVDAARRRDLAREKDTPSQLEAFDALAEAVQSVYGPMVERDEVRRAQLEETLTEQRVRVDSSEANLKASQTAVSNLQSALEKLLRGAFDAMSEAFTAQVRADQGEEGDLFHEPVLPEQGRDEPIRWRVTPRWSRTAGERPQPYRPGENTGQEKLKSMQLVLAALRADAEVAGTGLGGRMLILDELGAALGAAHRDLVLAGLRAVARDHGITVLGTIQDDLYEAAVRYAGMVLVLRYRSRDEDLNDPNRMLIPGPDGRLVTFAQYLQAARDGRFTALSAFVPDDIAHKPDADVSDNPVDAGELSVPDTIPDELFNDYDDGEV